MLIVSRLYGLRNSIVRVGHRCAASTKAVASLSGWGNLTTAMYGGDTPAVIWGSILVESGAVDGREPKELIERWHELLGHYDVQSCLEWADVRSPLNYTELLCGGGRKTPVLISNNMEDRLFKVGRADSRPANAPLI